MLCVVGFGVIVAIVGVCAVVAAVAGVAVDAVVAVVVAVCRDVVVAVIDVHADCVAGGVVGTV